MAYYLMQEKKKGIYTPLDITKSKCFYRTSNLKNMGCTLQEIDLFTMNFENEKELRSHLFREGLIEMRYAGRPLSVRILRNNKYYKVMYDMLYQKDIEYIMDPKLLIERINNKLLTGDYRFVEKYANAFLEFHDCLSTAPEVREFAKSSLRDNKCCKHFYAYDENNDNPVVRMTKLLIYDYYQEPSGKIKYKETIKYRNLHSVLAFVNNYDKLCEQEKINQTNNQTSLFEEPIKPKTKKKIKRESIPGQTNLFDE